MAVRIGERLEELDRQRQRALDGKFLIQCWLEVSNSGHLATLEDVKRLGGGDGKVRCAHIARQLLRISQRLDPNTSRQVNGDHSRNVSLNGFDGVNGKSDNGPGKHETREVIERFLEGLEKDLLKQFDDFYRRQNFDGMRVISEPPKARRLRAECADLQHGRNAQLRYLTLVEELVL